MRIAHLTDTHLDGSRDRRERFVRGLVDARTRGAEHLLLTGDLTARGTPAQYGELISCVGDNGWNERTTFVGGNHDGAAFEGSSETRDLGSVIVVPVSTYYPKRSLLFRALGKAHATHMGRIEEAALSQRPVVVAMHHGPQRDPLRVFASLVNGHSVTRLLGRYPNVFICCGHDHRVLDRSAQVFVAAACAHHPDPLRLYDVVGGKLVSSYKSTCSGSYLGDPNACSVT